MNSRIGPVPLLDARGNRSLDDKGHPRIRSASSWLDVYRHVEQMTWCPGKGAVVADRIVSDGGWIEKPGCSVFNLYRPPTPMPGDASKARHWIALVRKAYPEDADHIIAYLAHRVQRPDEKINHALFLGGSPGIGKDTLLQPVKTAVGAWNWCEVSPKQTYGRFNGFLKSVVLRISEARDLGELDRYGFYEHVKTYTAAPPDVLRVDEKFLREHAVFNVTSVIITSNHKTDGIYLPADDRRHYVAWSPRTLDDFRPRYWKELYRWYAAGGEGHVAAYLRAFDLSAFDPKAPPPKTPAFWDIVSANNAPEDADMADALDKLRWPDVVTIHAISNSAGSDEFSQWLKERKHARQIPYRLEAAGYSVVRNQRAKDGMFKVDERHCAIYAKKTLSPRDAIAAAEKLAADGWRF